MYTAFVRMLWDNDRAMMQEAKQYVHATDHLADTLKPKKKEQQQTTRKHMLSIFDSKFSNENL